MLYRVGLLRVEHVGVPVIVVGNLTVGGTGKTPVAAWLARQLAARGRRVGVVLRGYGGSHRGAPRVVNGHRRSERAVTRRCCTRAVACTSSSSAPTAWRQRAWRPQQGAEVVVCDDGLQHAAPGARLRNRRRRRRARTRQRLVVAGRSVARARRRAGIGPCGRRDERAGQAALELAGARAVAADGAVRTLGDAVNLLTGERAPLGEFAVRPTCMRSPASVTRSLFSRPAPSAGSVVRRTPCPTMQLSTPRRCRCPLDAIVLMTEKDAVKCRQIARPDWWWVDLELSFDSRRRGGAAGIRS